MSLLLFSFCLFRWCLDWRSQNNLLDNPWQLGQASQMSRPKSKIGEVFFSEFVVHCSCSRHAWLQLAIKGQRSYIPSLTPKSSRAKQCGMFFMSDISEAGLCRSVAYDKIAEALHRTNACSNCSWTQWEVSRRSCPFCSRRSPFAVLS